MALPDTVHTRLSEKSAPASRAGFQVKDNRSYHDDSSDDGFYDYLSEEDDDYDEISYLRHKVNRLELDNKYLSQQNTHLGKEMSFSRYTVIAMRNMVSQKESSLQAASQELDKAHFRIRMLESMLMGHHYDTGSAGMDQSHQRSRAISALKNHRSNYEGPEEDEGDSYYDDDDDYEEAPSPVVAPSMERGSIKALLPIRTPSPSDDISESRRFSQDISGSASDSDESSIHQSSPPSHPSDDKVNIWNKSEDLFADDIVDIVGWHDDDDTNSVLKTVQTSHIPQPVATSL
ncbi:hypothetical protein INT43_005248 [Umbelopsis isabellina]|uniref:Uncharacterized protein n=1 Tax=Mortierella isabellina TaxID=91625 RepID=A0A8H7UBH9_MORIS|nr:hypothetical protein INT43_005248 [Umbelopsis isabellina]